MVSQAGCTGSWWSSVVGLPRLLPGFGWLVISRFALVAVLPLDFHGRIRVVRTMFILGALHGIEASLLAQRSARTANCNIKCCLV